MPCHGAEDGAHPAPSPPASGHRCLKPSRRRLTTRQSYSSAICAKVTGTCELPDGIRPSSPSSGVPSPGAAALRRGAGALRKAVTRKRSPKGAELSTRRGWLQHQGIRTNSCLSGVTQTQVTGLWAGNHTRNRASSLPAVLCTAPCSHRWEAAPAVKQDHRYSSPPSLPIMTSW